MNHLVDLLCLCLLCLTGKTLCDKDEPPVIVVEGSDVVLPCSLSTKEDVESELFDWRKVPQKYEGPKEVFQYNAGIHYNNGLGGQSEEFKGRVSHFQDELKHGDASIIIRNTTISDSGVYRCDFPNLQPPQTFYIQLVVVEPSKVITVKEDSDVVLPCSLSTKEDVTSGLFDWRKVARKNEDLKEVFLYVEGIHYNNGRGGQSEEFKGRVSHFQDKLKHGDASITIRNTKISDSGNYSCDFPKLQTPQTFYIQLVVELVLKDRSGENIPGAAPKPLIESLKVGVLQCKVHGNPTPKVEWRDRDGNVLAKVTERGDGFNIVLQTTVEKNGIYRCVATQEEIQHQIYAEISVDISGLSTGWIVLIVVAVVVVVNVVVVITVAVLVNQGYITLHRIKVINLSDGIYTRGQLRPSPGWIVLIFLALVVGGVVALSVLVKKGYIEIDINKGTKVIKVEEGSDATLAFHIQPKKDIRSKVFIWRKRSEVEGGKQKNVLLYDKDVLNKGQSEEVKGQDKESEKVEGQDEQFRGRVEYFPEELKEGNASIIIRKITMADSGKYICIYQYRRKPQTFKFNLVVEPKVITVEEGSGGNLPLNDRPQENLRLKEETS